MKRILITLTFVLATLTIGSAIVARDSSTILDHTVLLSDDNPPPICPPICAPPPPPPGSGSLAMAHRPHSSLMAVAR